MLKIALIFSIILQFIAAFYALRLIKVSKGRISWILISVGLVLMAVRRLIEVLPQISGARFLDLLNLNSWVGVIISIIITFGVILIGEIFNALNKAEKDILKSEEKYRLLAQAATEGILLVINGKINYSNEPIQQLLGYSKDEFLNMELYDLFVEKQSAEIQEIVFCNNILRNELPPPNYSARIRHKNDKMIKVILVTSKVSIAGQEGFIIIIKER